MSDTTNHEEEREPVRKILRSLPEVKASDDFELQLQRRLAHEGESKSLWSILFTPKRIPAFALSLMAAVTAGVVVYYTVLRTGMVPEAGVPKHEVSVQGKEKEQPTAPQQSAPAPSSRVSQGQGQKREASGAAASQGSVRKTQTTASPSSTESAQDELSKQGVLKEVGGAGTPSTRIKSRSTRPTDMPEVPFLRAVPHTTIEKEYDSAAVADSAKRDSIKRLERQKK